MVGLDNGLVPTIRHAIFWINDGCWLTHTLIARFMGQTWDPPGSCRPQMGPMLAPWALLSGYMRHTASMSWNVGQMSTFIVYNEMGWFFVLASFSDNPNFDRVGRGCVNMFSAHISRAERHCRSNAFFFNDGVYKANASVTPITRDPAVCGWKWMYLYVNIIIILMLGESRVVSNQLFN